MRSILVVLITFLFLAPGIGVSAGDLFLVRIVSVDKETKQVVVNILDGPAAPKDQTAHPDAAISPEVAIASETLAMDFKPGDITRVWGILSATGKDLILQDSVSPSGGGSDPTGVRRRLRNRNNPHGSGKKGRGHG